MSNAYEIFQRLRTEGYQAIIDMINNKQEENVFLDFKEKSDANIPGAQGDDRKTYAKAVSGFSNSSGGIIIWGVKAGKSGKEFPDSAQEAKPIRYVRRFLTDLNSYTGQALVPLNTGIQNELILFPGVDDTGFVVTFVPESELPPHRALLGSNQYYTRSGDSFVVMEHHMLADMFGKRQKPNLDIDYKVSGGARFGNGTEVCRIQIGIKNTGRYVGVYPSLVLRSSTHSLTGPSVSGYPRDSWSVNQSLTLIGYSSFNNAFVWNGGINDVIHPFMTKGITMLEKLISPNELLSEIALVIEYEIYAQDSQPKKDTLTIFSSEIKTTLGMN